MAASSPLTFPYSREYEAHTVGPGSFPRFRMSTQPKPSSWAREGPNKKPLESRPVGKSCCYGAAVWCGSTESFCWSTHCA